MRLYKQIGDRGLVAHTTGCLIETLESRIKLSCDCAAHDPGPAGMDVAALEADAAAAPEPRARQEQRAPRRGSGIVLDNLTQLTLPVLGTSDVLVIDQAILTDVRLVEDAAGAVVGLEVTGILQGVRVTALGDMFAVNEEFTSTLAITNSGPGKCEVVTVDLGPLRLDALGIVTTDVQQVHVDGKGSGAVGALLCTLGGLLAGGGGGAGGVVDAINNQI